jgi:hypothetical protein
MHGLTHYQAGKPPHWQLQDDVALPNGRHLTGAKARVYEILRLARDTAHCFRVGKLLAPAGWVPVWVFREPWAGGSAGDRRVRDLRHLGIPLEGKPFDAGDGAISSLSWIWRLGSAEATPPTGGSIPRKKSFKARDCAQPLAGVTFHLRPGPRPTLWSGELLDLSPGMPHVAAPTASLAQRVTEGRLSPAEAEEAYRQQLLAAWRCGELARAFRAGTVTLCCEAPFSALYVLERALVRLGATPGGPPA